MALHRKQLHDDATSEVTGEAFNVRGKAGATLQVSGIDGDTITVQGTVDGEVWNAIDAINMDGGSRSTTISTDGLYWVPAPGLTVIRANITSHSSGTIDVWAGGTEVPYGVVPA